MNLLLQKTLVRNFLLFIVLFPPLAVSPTRAGGGPENVCLVVNSASVDSLTVANQYIASRNIPPANVVYLHWNRPQVTTSSNLFKNRILNPVLEAIRERKIGSQIDYIVYSCGFPYRIRMSDTLPGEYTVAQRPFCSISSATYLYAFLPDNRKEILSINNNFYFSRPVGGITISRGFRATTKWSPGGIRSATNGLPYMLSSVLGVTEDGGNTVNEIRYYLLKAAEADHTSPGGTIYFMKNDSVRSTPRHGLFPAAMKDIGLSGVRATILEGVFPQGKFDVMGVTCGAPKIDVAGSRCRFLPGAFIDNLTSAGGRFHAGNAQTSIAEFLRRGAAGACGTVVEPTNTPAKFPSPFLFLHYVRGCTLAESFYQSVAGPYQQVLVGDPLCQPWAKDLGITVAGFTPGENVAGTLSLLPSSKLHAPTQMKGYVLYVDGVAKQVVEPGGRLEWDSTGVADGYHQLTVVGIEDSPLETNGRWQEDVVVKNGHDAVALTLLTEQLARDTKVLKFQVASTATQEVIVKHNFHELGRVAEGNGEMYVETKTLGHGPITLFAETEGDNPLRSKPLEFELP